MKFQRVKYVIGALLVMLSGISVAAPTADPLELEQYRGQVVIVDFWASWCLPCRRSFPWMNAMQAKYGEEGLVVVAVNVDRDRRAAEQFLAEVPAEFRIHYDNEAAVAEAFGVEAMPSSFVIGRDGSILARHLGFKVRKQDEYEAVLVSALGVSQ